MGLTNLILTVTRVSAVVLLLKSDVKQSAAIFRRNAKRIRNWLEEESAAASREAEKVTKGIEEKVSKKNVSGGEKVLAPRFGEISLRRVDRLVRNIDIIR